MLVKESRKLERVFKGVANHWRIDILFLIKKSSEISLSEISDRLKANRKTISEHTWRLYKAGLINKNYKGRQVVHSLSPYGEKVIKILNNF